MAQPSATSDDAQDETSVNIDRLAKDIGELHADASAKVGEVKLKSMMTDLLEGIAILKTQSDALKTTLSDDTHETLEALTYHLSLVDAVPGRDEISKLRAVLNIAEKGQADGKTTIATLPPALAIPFARAEAPSTAARTPVKRGLIFEPVSVKDVREVDAQYLPDGVDTTRWHSTEEEMKAFMAEMDSMTKDMRW